MSNIGKLRGVVLALSGKLLLALSLETSSTLAMIFLSRLSEYNGCVLACALITRHLKISKWNRKNQQIDLYGCIGIFCGKCASYIIQLFNSGTEVADIELRLSAPCVIAYHVGCCCKHAGFEVPEAASAQVASIESE